jgi:carboxyl-terminal processing protease
MTLNKLTTYLLIGSISLLLFGSGYRLGQRGSFKQSGQPTEIIKDFSLFWDVWAELDKNFVDEKKLDKQAMFYGSIKGMVASLGDPYTFFLTPKENQESKDDLGGKFEGIGAQLGQKDSQIIVIAPLKSSPAEKSGMKSGDVIVDVDGKSTQGWTLLQAVSAIRGEKGTTVKIKVMRSGKEILFTIKRDQIIVESVELTYEKGIANVKLIRFGEFVGNAYESARVRDVIGHVNDAALMQFFAFLAASELIIGAAADNFRPNVG